MCSNGAGGIPSSTPVDAVKLGALVSRTAPSTYGDRAADLVNVAAEPSWAQGLTLPPYAVSTEAPPDSSGVLRYMAASPRATAPLFPSLFMPGFPKSATTSLYDCLLATFTPLRLCGETAWNWSRAACRRRFLVAPLETHAQGRFLQRKETFFFGGALADKFQARASATPSPPVADALVPSGAPRHAAPGRVPRQADLMAYHGPNPRGGPLKHKPALWAWEAMLRCARPLAGRWHGAACRPVRGGARAQAAVEQQRAAAQGPRQRNGGAQGEAAADGAALPRQYSAAPRLRGLRREWRLPPAAAQDESAAT